jgi:putative ribosome biogenesis GTPase RsgA
VQLKAFPELTTQPIEALTVFTYNANVNNVFLITDYGAIEERQVNSNKLAYRESNVLVVNFAVKQNQNFERMAS